MAQIPIVGPSYNIRVRKADIQRSINLFPSIVESGAGKAPAILQSIPGLTLFADGGSETRAMRTLKDGRLFVVNGSNFNEISATGTVTNRGTLATTTGAADIAQNLIEAIIVDGPNGYVYNLTTNVYSQNAAVAFNGSVRVSVLNGRAIYVKPNSQQFSLSAIDDATVIDTLDFASAESSPDNIVTHIVDHGQVFFFGETGIEIWDDTGGTDFPLTRNEGAKIETGASAAFSVQKLDNTVYWLGNDERGGGIVWKLNGFTPARVSTQAIEEMLQSVDDLSQANAYTYQQDGHSFYCLNVPGLNTTLCFDVASGAWHERAEWQSGAYAQHRGQFHAYAFGKHLIGTADGKIYEYDPEVNTNAGDILIRDRISPHFATPTYKRIPISTLQVDCVVGKGRPDGSEPSLMMRYSNDGGIEWGDWRTVGMGAIGARRKRCIFRRLATAYDRVWQLRCTDDTQFSIVGANVE